MPLHINIEDLLSAHTVESDRIEFKEGWNPDPIYRSIGAFANDFDNTGGGYIVIGVVEDKATRTARRPVKGLTTAELGTIQTEMIGLNNLIKPYYAPKLFVEQVDGRQIIVLWVIAGNERPYEVPEQCTAKHKNWKYYIRKYASSIEAKGADKEELIALSNNIPFDDRANSQATVQDISLVLVQDHLRKIDSKLANDVGTVPNEAILQQMALLSGPNEYLYPRNVGLMLFSEEPHWFFPYTRVELVHFPEGDAEAFTEYPFITGPIQEQIRRTINFLKTNFLKERVVKPTDRAESIRTWNYPLAAIEETLVNAFYHRDYQVREPIEIRIYRNSLVFINHGGPDRSIQLQAFAQGVVRPRRYRNRRLGDFLKELGLTEGRATGVPTIHKALRDNGSPAPIFTTDDNRTYFEVELFIHPDFKRKISDFSDFLLETKGLAWIDAILDELIENSKLSSLSRGIAGGIAGGIAKKTEDADKQSVSIVENLSSTIASTLAGDIAGGIGEKTTQVLEMASKPMSRRSLMEGLQLTNNANNFETYIQPLVALNWLSMTTPNKPTSPKQQYLTTLKGRLILQLLKHPTP